MHAKWEHMPCWASHWTLPAANQLKTRPFGPNNQLKDYIACLEGTSSETNEHSQHVSCDNTDAVSKYLAATCTFFDLK